MTLEPVDRPDPTGRGRRIFKTVGDAQPPGNDFPIVIPKKRNGEHRLVIGQMGTPMVVLTMASVPGEKR